jgi:hypothetical protein
MALKRFLSLLAFIVIGILTAGADLSDDTIVKKEIIVTSQDKSNYDRNAPCCINAFYLPMSSEVEVSCFGEGVVTVYLFNSRNQLCGYADFDSSETYLEKMDVPSQSGMYYLIIITATTYSEGSFSK